MKTLLKLSVLGLVAVFLFSSCGKRPEQEIQAAQAAIEAVSKAGADVYAADELKKLNDDLTTAMDQVNTQGKKLFKKYGDTKELLSQLKANADTLQAEIPARIETAKNNALTALTEAKTALDEAVKMLAGAPKGKGTKADLEAMKADLQGLEASLTEAQGIFDGSDFLGALDKATTIKDKALMIVDEIEKAMEKVGK